MHWIVTKELTFEQPGVDDVKKKSHKVNYMFMYNHFLTTEEDFLITHIFVLYFTNCYSIRQGIIFYLHNVQVVQ